VILIFPSRVNQTTSKHSTRGLDLQERAGLNDFDDSEVSAHSFLSNGIVDPLHTYDNSGYPLLSQASKETVFLPRWQTSPVLETSQVNENLLEATEYEAITKDSIASKAAVLGGFHFAPRGGSGDLNATAAFFSTLQSMSNGTKVEYNGDPMTHIAVPVFDSLYSENREVVAVLIATFNWGFYMEGILDVNNKGYTVVIENRCDEVSSFTYTMKGEKVYAEGIGDRHDRKFTDEVRGGQLEGLHIGDGTTDGISFNQDSCPYTFRVYPTQEDYDSIVTDDPVNVSIGIAFVFAFTISLFLCYDRMVERRQEIVLARATHSTAIVSSLFVSVLSDVSPVEFIVGFG